MSKYAYLVDPEKEYPVTYTTSYGKVILPYPKMLKGKDLTANQIDLLYKYGHLKKPVEKPCKCTNAPAGWYCKRSQHEDGPCAMVRESTAVLAKSIDVERELSELFGRELMKSIDQRNAETHERIKAKVEDFMRLTNNNLDALFKYLYSAYQGCRLGNVEAGEYIAEHYGDDFYLRRELLSNEESTRAYARYEQRR